MRPTKNKKIPKYVPEFLPFVIKPGLSAMYDVNEDMRALTAIRRGQIRDHFT